MRILGDQFVLGRTIREALDARRRRCEAKGYRFSYDMLGEAARTRGRRRALFRSLHGGDRADRQDAGVLRNDADVRFADGASGISVKLSALHPRFEPGKEDAPRARVAAAAARAGRGGARARASASPSTRRSRTGSTSRWSCSPSAFIDPRSMAGRLRHRRAGLRQARHPGAALAAPRWPSSTGKRIPVRLVKGAYWDSEIKWAQERGLADYPVFTRKLHTDVSYLACDAAAALRSAAFYPQFATHNAHTIAVGHRRRRQRVVRVPAPARHGRGALRARSSATASSTARAASMRRSAATRTCSPIWCAACSRTAPTPRSSTGWPTRRRRSRRSSRDPVEIVEREHDSRRTRAAVAAAARDLSAGAQEQRRARA